MLVTAGYLNYTDRVKIQALQTSGAIEIADIGDATLVNSQAIEENVNVESSISDTEESLKEVSEQIETEKKEPNDEYFTSSKLERDVMYSRNGRKLPKNVRFEYCWCRTKSNSTK